MIDVVQKYIRGGTAVNIASSIEDLITRARLGPGDRLPPVRALARDLGVSPTTVAAAYGRLRQRGLVEGRGRRGTRVTLRGPAARVAHLPPRPGLRDLTDGNPDPALLPDLARSLRALDPTPRLYGGPRHFDVLVRAARSRFETDGIPARDVLVTSGAMDGLERVLRAHLRPSDLVAVEDPGFPGVLDLVAGLGLRLHPVPVDPEGPTPEGMRSALRAGARALVYSPRAQNPTGAALRPGRVRALQRALRGHREVLLLEDDHVGDIAGAPAHTLVRGHRGPWAVVRSTSKSLGPDLRVALVAADPQTAARVDSQLALGMSWVSHLLQQTVADLWSRRAVARRLARAERTYAARRDALVDALAREGIAVTAPSGVNAWIPVPEEPPVVEGLGRRGWAVRSGERFRLKSGPAVRVTISTLEPADARRLAGDLARVLAARERSVFA